MKKIINEKKLVSTIEDLENMIEELQVALSYAPIAGYWDKTLDDLIETAYTQLEELKQLKALLGYNKAPSVFNIIEDKFEEELIAEDPDDIDWDEVVEDLLSDFDEEEEA